MTAQLELNLDFVLSRHRKSINALCLSPTGDLLLSGGDDGLLVVWNLRTGERLQEILGVFHGPVSAIAWVGFEEGKNDCFVFGCADGSLHVHLRLDGNAHFEFVCLVNAHTGAVEHIAVDITHRRIATVGDGSPAVWTMEKNRTLVKLPSEPVQQDFIARTVHFYEEGASIIVTYLESHQIVCYRIDPWGMKWSKQIPTRIGHADLSGSNLIISNLVSGVDQYVIPTMERLHTCSYPISRNVPIQVVVARGGQWIVLGGDDGFARIYDRRTGQFLGRLDHGRSGQLVQVVAAHSDKTGVRIVTGSSESGPSTIRVWSFSNVRKESRQAMPPAPPVTPSTPPASHSFAIVLSVLINVIIVVHLGLVSSGFSWNALLSSYRNHV